MALALQPSTATLSTRPPTPDHQNQPARVLHLEAGAGRAYPDGPGGRSANEHEKGRGHEWSRGPGAHGGHDSDGGASDAVDAVPATCMARLSARSRSPRTA